MTSPEARRRTILVHSRRDLRVAGVLAWLIFTKHIAEQARAGLSIALIKLFLHDYGAYPFSRELATVLQQRQFDVLYAFNASLEGTPSGWLDQGGHRVQPLDLGQPLRREKFIERWVLERRYGRLLSDAVAAEQPDVAVFANTPIDALVPVLRECRKRGIAIVVWVQDLLGVAIGQVLADKAGILGQVPAAWYKHRELECLRLSDAIISISESFTPYLAANRVDAQACSVIPNWAPVDEITPRPRANAWARQQQLDHRFTFLYSGTLGFKHRPELLVELAQAVAHREAMVVVNSRGAVADWLRVQAVERKIANLQVNDFQPIEQLPEVLASGDVLIGMLAPDAADYCVPSKILSNHCAGRSQLLSLSESNPAAQLVLEHRTGYVASPDDAGSFIRAALSLMDDNAERLEMGRRAREVAEELFNIDKIALRFEAIFEDVAKG